jgi:LysM repeat protein
MKEAFMSEIASTYEIKPGDSLSKIAVQFGLTLQAVLDVNQQIIHPDLIKIGEVINIPSAVPSPVLVPAPGHPSTYDGIQPAPGTVSLDRSHPINPPLTNAPGQRDAAIYSQLINQFAVGHNPRYIGVPGTTYCNIFVWDVSRAMGAEVAHWVDQSGDTATPGAPHANEIVINAGVNWMLDFGISKHGWRKATPQEAQDAANLGEIAVVMWKNPNPGHHGHTAVVRPGSINANGPTIAQAGLHNFNMGHVVDSFATRSPLQYFCHD